MHDLARNEAMIFLDSRVHIQLVRRGKYARVVVLAPGDTTHLQQYLLLG